MRSVLVIRIVGIPPPHVDIRTQKVVEGRSINLALSARGIKALHNAGLDAKVLEMAIPMRGRMIHPPDGHSTSFIPYGDFGEVGRAPVVRMTVNVGDQLCESSRHQPSPPERR